jgi:adenylate kinase
MRLLIMGPPGVGKGTQASLLADALGVPAISTGEIFRANMAALTPLGLDAKAYLDAGEYVPDQVTSQLVRDRLQHSDASRGWLLDGFPRTLAQVAALDDICSTVDAAIESVVVLEADGETLVKRLLQRAVEQGRPDDTEGVIRRRQEVYRRQTEQLIGVYRDRGIVSAVPATGSVSEVHARLLATIATARADPAVFRHGRDR